MTVGQLMQAAVARHRAGDLGTAENAYRQILKVVPSHPDALQLLGVVLYQKGETDAAMPLIERAIETDPGRAGPLINLAKIQFDLGQLEQAEKSLSAALERDPGNVDGMTNMIGVLRDLKRYGDAVPYAESLLRLKPDFPNIHFHLANLYLKEDRFEDAETHYRKHLERQPDDAMALGNLGFTLEKLNRVGEAREYYERAFSAMAGPMTDGLTLPQLLQNEEAAGKFVDLMVGAAESAPDQWPRQTMTARVIGRLGRVDAAVEVLRAIAEAHPDDAVVWNDTGAALIGMDKASEAEKSFRKAIEIDPELVEAHNNLGNCFMLQHRDEDAVAAYKAALEVSPRYVSAHINLCRALRQLNRLDEANLYAHAALSLQEIETGQRVNPYQVFRATCDFAALATLGDRFDLADALHPEGLKAVFLDLLVDAEDRSGYGRLLVLHRKWGAWASGMAGEHPLPPRPPRKKGRKPRVGVLSSDLKSHSVARFLTPLLLHYDKSRCEIFCYTPQRVVGDTLQNLFQTNVDRFTFLEDRSEREIAETIQSDEVDILIELNGFTMSTKILTLAYRPAPVQICWLGYPFTTGLDAVDYLLLDPYVRPARDDLLIEKPLLLPDSWVCFGNFARVEVDPVLPVERSGRITFGTLNNQYKFNPEVIRVWARILNEIPGSRFLIVRPEARSVILRSHVTQEFVKHGIEAERILFIDNASRRASHLVWYNEIDVCLDTFPLVGGTTTCEALWMGAPVVTLVGESMHERMSYSILTNAGLGDLAVRDEEAFVKTACELAEDRKRLAELRGGLRSTLEASPLCRIEPFVRNFHDAMEAAAKQHGLV